MSRHQEDIESLYRLIGCIDDTIRAAASQQQGYDAAVTLLETYLAVVRAEERARIEGE